MKLLYGTGNLAKLSAMRNRLEQLDIELIGLNDLRVEGKNVQEVKEDGNTPLENARLKAVNCPKMQLVQILHKLRITEKPINISFIRYLPSLPLATVSTPAGQHNSGNGQQKCWIPLRNKGMF